MNRIESSNTVDIKPLQNINQYNLFFRLINIHLKFQPVFKMKKKNALKKVAFC